MNAIEHTMVSRVSEFVAAMNDLDKRTGTATAAVEEHLGTFNTSTVKVLHDLGDLSAQFSAHGHSLAEAVALLEQSSRRSEESVATRHATIESLVATLDARTDDFEQRLRRFSGLLDESLESATARSREIADIVAATSNDSVHTIEQQLDAVRNAADEQRKRTSETLNSTYRETAGEVDAMFNQSAQRFTEVIQGMKQMAAEMQRELEATRAELRRGLFELPQETAESTAQMRRVIVDQIEALAELNRIVARHGRALDAAEPTRREFEPAFATAGRAQQRPARPDAGPGRPVRDITGAPTRRPDAPPLSPIPSDRDGNGRGGWLSDLLTRASREETPPAPATPPAQPAPSVNQRAEQRAPRDSVGSLETLSVDIARMIDPEATAALWERYQRGERGLGGARLYNAQGQRAFEEIRNKYRTDPEFQQTVDHYIREFERVLGEASRGERGPAVARNYLTSDVGKVYTMLAHAAGRFEQ
jgi:DNA anti-recombination protein RmuC